MAKQSPLLEFLSGRLPATGLDTEAFSLLLAEARTSGVLGRLAWQLQQHPDQAISDAPALQAARIYSEGFRQDVWRELKHIEEDLSNRMQSPVLLLKGAAYVLLGLPVAEGRTFSDVDILVPPDHIANAEAALMLGGWSAGKPSAYDQRYYRQWSHEIPPMTHIHRGTTIDLHHSLVMPTCRIKVDSAKMIAEAIPASENGFWWRLKNEDMVLHAISHLLLNSEFDRGLRDLWDIDLLYRHFSANTPNFPERLLIRAREVGLEKKLKQALALAKRLLHTPVPESHIAAKNELLMHLLAVSASTRHPDTRPAWQGFTDLLLMLREMFMRLPGNLFAIHLWHKITQLFARPPKKPL